MKFVMDITTLPMEMVTNILKYIEFEELFRLRKLNCQMDSIIKRAKLGERVPVAKFKIFCRESGQMFLAIELDQIMVECLGIPRNSETWRYDREDFREIMADFAKRITIRYSLEWGVVRDFNHVFFKNLGANKEVVKNLKKFTFFSDPTYPSKTQMTEFISLCPKLNYLHISTNHIQSSDTILNTEVLGGRKWKRLTISYDTSELSMHHVDNQFLMEVVKNCDTFYLYCVNSTTSLTIHNIITLLKTILEEGEYNKEIYIQPYVQLGDVLLENVEQLLFNLTGQNVTIQKETILHGGVHIWYCLDFDNGGYLRFTVLDA